MKILKRILLGLVALVALFLIIALFVKKEYTIEKEVIVNKARQEVFDYAKKFSNQNEFSAWYKMDTKAKTEVIGPDGEVGAKYTWDSEITGKGEQTIVGLDDGELISSEIHFIKPFEGLAITNMYFESLSPEQTKVRNTFGSSMPYPMNFMLLFMNMENSLGGPMQDGLNNMKANLESRPASSPSASISTGAGQPVDSTVTVSVQ